MLAVIGYVPRTGDTAALARKLKELQEANKQRVAKELKESLAGRVGGSEAGESLLE